MWSPKREFDPHSHFLDAPTTTPPTTTVETTQRPEGTQRNGLPGPTPTPGVVSQGAHGSVLLPIPGP